MNLKLAQALNSRVTHENTLVMVSPAAPLPVLGPTSGPSLVQDFAAVLRVLNVGQ